MSLDSITEVIAHFFGALRLNSEDTPLRQSYMDFDQQEAPLEVDSDLSNINVNIKTPYEFNPFRPDVKYTPSFPEITKVKAQSDVGYNPIPTKPGFVETFDPGFNSGISPTVPAFNSSQNIELTAPDPPGSIAVVGIQNANIFDDDIVISDEFENTQFAKLNMLDELQPLIRQADNHSPIPELTRPEDEAAIGELIEQIGKIVENLKTESPEDLGATGPEAIGFHTNGNTVDEVPVLQDYVSDEPPQPETAEQNSEFFGAGEFSYSTSITIEAGDNTLVNQASIVNVWALSPVVAVGEDSHSYDVISQVSVTQSIHDIDGFSTLSDETILAADVFNVASLQRPESTRSDNAESAGGATTFPSFWTVTRLDTDLTILNWIEQINYISDADIIGFSSSGAEVELGTGGNTAVNGFSLLELGYSFDLIAIGGNYYSANVINQKNILLDNDSVEVVGNGTAAGSVTVGDNLAWNAASITATGSINFESMPAHYMALHEGLSEGSDGVSAAVLKDSVFEGLEGLRVLYIEGDYYDLQYIKQTNILGDNDQVKILTDGLSETNSDEWSIETGGNVLINTASIVDVIPDTTVYVGGEQYSDALIFQADLMPTDELLADDDPGTVLNEAIVFLSDDLLEPDIRPDTDCNDYIGSAHAGSGDVMQTMLG